MGRAFKYGKAKNSVYSAHIPVAIFCIFSHQQTFNEFGEKMAIYFILNSHGRKMHVYQEHYL